MSQPSSRMAEEIQAAPDVVARQATALAEPIADLAARLRQRVPDVVVTCARGSSAHAATFAKHLIERYLGVPVSAAAPSIASIYGGELRLKDQLFLAVSQSGRSDDLIAMAHSAKTAGAHTVALVNAIDSPLAAVCDTILPIGAGPEVSVAATKTFVATASALMRLTAAWSADQKLTAAVDLLPRRLAIAGGLDWGAALEMLGATGALATIGRGPTLAMAREAALKLKETCNLHAEAFSGAEFLHGPVALASPRHPIFMLMPTDAAADGMRQLASDLHRMHAPTLITGTDVGNLPVVRADQPEADAICLIQSFYGLTERLARRLGIDVDRPRNLQKVTRTQ
jgi:glucosamine--fructose-6-phosphate aminotransferase (isomerizing)